jgi:predicted DNA-binding transcriptional regulator YafY
MRADRLLSILLSLQVHRRMTARELAARLEVSERTIHRDMEALGAAGVPVVAERGAGGGWSLLESYRTDLTGLNEAEIQSLFLTNPPRLLADLGLGKASEAALIKLFAAIPSFSRRDAEFTRQRIHIDGAAWHRPNEQVPLLSTLQEAIWQERKLRLVYERGEGNLIERLADPLGLVAKGNVWYLVASVDGDLRTYRVSRIDRVDILDQPCERPQHFDLAAFWEQSISQFKANLPRYLVTMRVTEAVLARLRSPARLGRLEQVGEPDKLGWTTVVVRFDVEWEACEYVLSCGSHVEVLVPNTLRQRVVETAQSILQRYTQPHDDKQDGPSTF